MIARLRAALRALLRQRRPQTAVERRATGAEQVPPAQPGRATGRPIDVSALARIALAGRC